VFEQTQVPLIPLESGSFSQEECDHARKILVLVQDIEEIVARWLLFSQPISSSN
jgi:hypothetical protein